MAAVNTSSSEPQQSDENVRLLNLLNEQRSKKVDVEDVLLHGPMVALRAVMPPADVGTLWDALYRRGIKNDQERLRRAGQLLVMAARNNAVAAIRSLLNDLYEENPIRAVAVPLKIHTSWLNAAIRKAAKWGHADALELLLGPKGASCNLAEIKSSKSGANCLMLAAASGSKRCFHLVFTAYNYDSSVLREKDWADNSVLMATATNCFGEGTIDIAEFLVQMEPSLLNAVNCRGETVLITAAACNNERFVRWLVDGPMKADWRSVTDSLNRTAFMVAANSGALDVVRLLLSRGADIKNEAVTIDGWTILMCASISGSLDVVRLLLDNGADLSNESRNKAGWTPVMCAIYSGCVDLVRLLIERGADVSNAARDKAEQTALMHAALEGSPAIVRLLLDNGADRLAEDEDGWTALDHALSHSHRHLADMLAIDSMWPFEVNNE